MEDRFVVGVGAELDPGDVKSNPATTGARTWGGSIGACDEEEIMSKHEMSPAVSLPTTTNVQLQGSTYGTWSDVEVNFKQPAAHRRTSGYASADGTTHGELSRESHRSTDWTGPRQTLSFGLKSPSDFSTSSTVYPTR